MNKNICKTEITCARCLGRVLKKMCSSPALVGHSVKTKSPVKSSACLVKVKLSSFGPVIVQEIWRCDGILIEFQGSSISSQARTLLAS